MDLSKTGAPPKVGFSHLVSKLNDEGQLANPTSHTDRAAWAKLAAAPGASGTKARALVYIAEGQIGSEEPGKAEKLLNQAIAITPKKSPERGLAQYDHSLALYFQGKYAQAQAELHGLLKTKPRGANLKQAVILYKHSAACAGYHEQRARMGITEPTRVDPLCAASGLAVCLRELHLPYDEAKVLSAVRHTGQGSNLQDVLDGAPKLGAGAYAIQSGSKEKLLALPMPLVAHVEHDHFIAVVKMDKDGVTYNCSDCGSWPGGFKRVDWKQWNAMEADAYAVITKGGSILDATLRADSGQATPEMGSLNPILDAVSGDAALAKNPQAVAIAERAARAVEALSFTGYAPFLPGTGVICAKLLEPRCINMGCDPLVQLCPMLTVGSDPVDLATGEEEYTAADLHVYNPVGPAVHFERIYDSLRSDGLNYYGFGQGWSNPYNISVQYVPKFKSGTYNGTIVMPNGATMPFTWPSTAAGFNSSLHTLQYQQQTVTSGYPANVTEWYDGTNGDTWVVVQFSNGITWTTARPSTGVYKGSVVSIATRNGNSLALNYSNYTIGTIPIQLLTSISCSAGTLLTLAVSSTTGMYTSATDCYGRSVYYTYTYGIVGTENELYQASQIVATGTSSPAMRYQYGYTVADNGEGEAYQYLNAISVPSSTGSGLSTETLNYDSTDGLLTSVTDANGNNVSFSGGTTSNETMVTYTNASSVNEYQYTVSFNSDMSQTALYDSAGSAVYTANYSSSGDPFRPSSITDGLSHTWNLTWDAFGHMLTDQTPKGTTTTHTYSYSNWFSGELSGSYTGSQTATSYSYDPSSGFLTSVTAPIPGNVGSSSTQTTSYTYSSLGNLLSVTSPGNNSVTNHTTYYGYTTDGTYSQSEALGQPITVTDSNSKVTHLRYDSQANLLNSTDSVGNEWQATYNIANQTTSTVAPATGNTGTGNATTVPTYLYTGGPVTTDTAYDESGTSARSVSYTYGQEGETLSVSGDAETTSVTYGSPYWIKSITDGNSHTTTYTHGTSTDPLSGDVTRVSFPLASGATDTMNYVYNVMHQPTQRTDGNSVVTNYSYSDGDGLLSSIAYPASTSLNVGITYDSYDRPYYVTDSTGTKTDSFDDLNEVTQSVRVYTGVASNTLTYTRYPDGSRNTMTVAGNTYTYYYDPDGRYTSMTSPVGTSSATYYDNGWQSSRTLPNGIVSSYSFGAVGALTALSSTLSGSTVSAFSSFGYDGVFNLTGFSANYGSTSGLPNGSRSFGYDSKDRLTSSSIPTSSTTTVSSTYGFDSAGNRTSVNSGSYSYNSDNQLTTPSTAFAYDGNGNPTTYAGTSRSFDPENRMISSSTSGSVTYVASAYRADGLRASKTTSSSTTYFLYDGAEPIVEMNSSGTVTAKNVFAPDGLVARTTSGGTTEYVFDQQGNVADRTNTSGAVQSITQYDGWGNEQAISGTVTDPFGYNAQSGYYLDRETGLYLCQHRFYDPVNARWLNRDPIGYAGGTNLYGYCAGGPVDQVDGTGYTVGSNLRFLWDWLTGSGPRHRFYGPGSPETGEMINSPGVNKLRNRFYDQGCNGFGNGSYGTVQAAKDTLLNPRTRDWGGTAAQVGGFGGASVVNNGDGTVTFTVPNTAGAHSFFYHLVPDRKSPTGPMSNIYQTFQWTEPIEPNKCPCTHPG